MISSTTMRLPAPATTYGRPPRDQHPKLLRAMIFFVLSLAFVASVATPKTSTEQR